jgi:hypothetical protein
MNRKWPFLPVAMVNVYPFSMYAVKIRVKENCLHGRLRSNSEGLSEKEILFLTRPFLLDSHIADWRDREKSNPRTVRQPNRIEFARASRTEQG